MLHFLKHLGSHTVLVVIVCMATVSSVSKADSIVATQPTELKRWSRGPGTPWQSAGYVNKGQFFTIDESKSDENWYRIILDNGEVRFGKKSAFRREYEREKAVVLQADIVNRNSRAEACGFGVNDNAQGDVAQAITMDAAKMTLSQKCLDFLKKYEGEVRDSKGNHEIYVSLNGKQTIGWGHELLPGEAQKFQNGISDSVAEQLFRKDLAIWEKAVKTKLAGVKLKQSEFDALVSFTYNLGDRLNSKSTFFGILKEKVPGETEKDREARVRRAFNAMMSFNKVTNRRTQKLTVSEGLQKRRAAELYLAINDRVPSEEKELKALRELYNSSIGRSGVSAHDNRYGGEKWN